MFTKAVRGNSKREQVGKLGLISLVLLPFHDVDEYDCHSAVGAGDTRS
jgi:hypothetical protein